MPASASAFSSGVALFLAHAVLGYSLAGAAAHVAVLALLLSLLVALKNAAVTSVAPTPPPSILLHASTVHAAAAAAGKAAAAAVLRANELLAWSDPAASARALAYAWLAARLAFLLAPAALVTAWVAAFAAAPLYEAHGRAADALVAARLLPLLARAAPLAAAAKAEARKAFAAENRGLAVVGSLTAAAVAVYVLWGAVAPTTLMTREWGAARGRSRRSPRGSPYYSARARGEVNRGSPNLSTPNSPPRSRVRDGARPRRAQCGRRAARAQGRLSARAP